MERQAAEYAAYRASWAEGRAPVTTLTLGASINAGIRRMMERDPRVMVMGEDVGGLGGVFRVTDGLQADFGRQRVVDTPLRGVRHRGDPPSAWPSAGTGRSARSSSTASSTRPSTRSSASWPRSRARSGGPDQPPRRDPGVLCGGGIGAVEHHSESNEALFAHTPGLRVVACASAVDGYALIQQAIASDDPVLFYEPKGALLGQG